jgi:hypothetical protein
VNDPRTREIVEGLGEAAASEADRNASAQIVDALRAHREAVGGIAAVPREDAKLSTAIMAEARSRSQEIRDAAAKRPAADRPIPWWLWLAWLAAIGLFAAGWFWLG